MWAQAVPDKIEKGGVGMNFLIKGGIPVTVLFRN